MPLRGQSFPIVHVIKKMRSLPKPEFDFNEILNNCINSRQEPIQSKLKNHKNSVNQATNDYDNMMRNIQGHQIKSIFTSADGDIKNEFIGLYKDKMLAKGSPARNVYDKILSRGKQKDCCFCSYEEALELDHFLPKSIFAEFAINPINLVPSCHRCNQAKTDYFSKNVENSFIHPYYEACVDNELWLKASIYFPENAPVISFFIREMTNSILKKRLEFEMNKLNLHNRYGSQAGREISNRKHRFKEIHKNGGAGEVQEDLKLEYKSRSKINKNSWISALYECLSESEQFCNMGWENKL